MSPMKYHFRALKWMLFVMLLMLLAMCLTETIPQYIVSVVFGISILAPSGMFACYVSGLRNITNWGENPAGKKTVFIFSACITGLAIFVAMGFFIGTLLLNR